ncbi:MAG1430 family protein [Mycoplasma tauri]|uniref:MAG1430 family protein n=1 Tax=Mycoplasma tauri TaxID=547987 RepID=UPI001CBC571D|nr:hypothetical protein [Mycoplasma tauri]MBZ4204150.1 hypothetical protein [Mycoplasma tauri]
MKKSNKGLIISSVFLASSVVATVASAAVFISVKKKLNNPIDLAIENIKNFQLKIKPNDIENKDGFTREIYNPELPNAYKTSEHYASEYTYISFYGFKSGDTEPTLKKDINYWPSIEENDKNKNKTPFILFDKNFLTENKNKYNIYYHSYANDFTGTLYLRVYLEEKNDTNKDAKKYKPNLKFVDYKIDGFKKIELNQNGKIDNKIEKELIKSYAREKHNFRTNYTVRNKFIKNEINSLDAIMDLKNNDISKIPTSENKNSEKIKESHSKFNSYFFKSNISHKDGQLKFEIDIDRPIWIEKKDNPEEYTINYYLKVYIPNAQYSDDQNDEGKNLNSIRELKIDRLIKTSYNSRLSKMALLSKNIEIDTFNNDGSIKKEELLPSKLEYISNGYNASKKYKNVSNGYIDSLNLDIKKIGENTSEEEKNILLETEKAFINQNEGYKLAYATVNDFSILKEIKFKSSDGTIIDFESYFKDKSNKELISKYSRTPFVKIDDKNGKAYIAYKIYHKDNPGNESSFVWIYELSGLKKQQ